MKDSSFIPTRIDLPETYLIRIAWSDGSEYSMTLEDLRNNCPCASCKGEVIMGKQVLAPAIPVFTPGMHEIDAINSRGNYAIQVGWKDGHKTGIYTWELLHQLCQSLGKSPDELEKFKQSRS